MVQGWLGWRAGHSGAALRCHQSQEEGGRVEAAPRPAGAAPEKERGSLKSFVTSTNAAEPSLS